MKQFLFILSVFITQCVSAQKQADVRSRLIYGKVSKVELTNISFRLNSKNEVEQNPGTDTYIFYFDENQNLIREQHVVDYSKLDATGKTKPKTFEIEVKPQKEPEKPISKTPIGAILDDAWVYHYTDGTRMAVVKRPEHPYHIIVGYLNKDDSIYLKKEFNKDSVLRAEIRFRNENPNDTIYVETYDERGNQSRLIPYNKGVRQHASQMYKYEYGKYANPTMILQSKWDVEELSWQAEYGYQYKYTYMKDQTGAVTAPAPAKDEEEKTADAGPSKSESGSSGSSEPKEKKSLKDKLNVFKKKD